MTLQQLKYADAVAKYGSITVAAEKLYLSQPSLTNAIHTLESEMGISIFHRTNKGAALTRDGEEFLSYARALLEQAELLNERFQGSFKRSVKFSVSCQHYSFAVNALIDIIKEYGGSEYDFTLRETQTHEIFDDVALGKSELGVIYLSDNNEAVLSKLIRKNNLEFTELCAADPHIFISANHPLASKSSISIDELQPYPYLTFEQGEHNSFYFSEEFLSTLDFNKNIKVRDRATLFNLILGVNGFTACSGIIDSELNINIMSKPLAADFKMRIGVLSKHNAVFSQYALSYIEALKKHLAIV